MLSQKNKGLFINSGLFFSHLRVSSSVRWSIQSRVRNI